MVSDTRLPGLLTNAAVTPAKLFAANVSGRPPVPRLCDSSGSKRGPPPSGMLVAMSRVEWTRLEGNDVEAVVAMFVNREHPRSVRITPSIGDGGVDIVDPRAGPEGTDDVYQVKKYTGPLTARQRSEVEGSLRTFTSDERWADLRLGTWYLVAPWNPTPEAYNWLKELAEKYRLSAVWHGLTYVEQLAAKYPDVVDYYLHGGATRIEAAYQAVMALDRVDRDGGALEVPEVVRRIQKALPSLDTDPHYRYELRFGEGQLPAGPQRPGLVMTTIVGQGKAGRWAAVDVIARCAASTAVRPITIKGKFLVGSGDPFAEALSDFHAFGVPFTSPEGLYEGEIDAPGGLGGRLEGATVTSFGATSDLGDNPELHLEVLDPGGAVLASADLLRVERSKGTTGIRVVLQEVNGIFTLEDRYNLKERTGSRNIRFGRFTGAPVTAAFAALTFLTHCKPPNVGRLSVRHTPPERGVLDPNVGFAWPDDEAEHLAAMFRLTEDLLTIQKNTSAVVRVPDVDELTAQQVAQWRFVASVLRDEDVTRIYPEGHQLLIELAEELPDSDLAGSVTITIPLTVDIDRETLDLGRVGVVLDNPTILQRIPQEDGIMHAFTTPDRSVRYQRLLTDG